MVAEARAREIGRVPLADGARFPQLRAQLLGVVGQLLSESSAPGGVDQLLGTVLENADGAFNTLLEMGFATAIRREYEWRTARGESTRNLAAFTHLTGQARGDAGRP